MAEEAWCVVDEREFCSCTLGNGLGCTFVYDPSLTNISVQLSVCNDIFSLPERFDCIDTISMTVLWRGSVRYPGVLNLKNFVSENGIDFRSYSDFGEQQIYAETPVHALKEYLNRVADMVSQPRIEQRGLDHAKLKYEQTFYALVKDDELRGMQIVSDILHLESFRVMRSLKYRDLLSRIREFVNDHYCPSKMRLIVAGNMACKAMEQLVTENFEHIPRKPVYVAQDPPRNPPAPLELLSQDDAKLMFARGYTTSDAEWLYVEFVLPDKISMSSALVIAYLLSRSTEGSLQHKLKSEGLIKELRADHWYRGKYLSTLHIGMSQTSEGSECCLQMLGALMGYIEIIKQVVPTEELFEQAREHFLALREKDDVDTKLDHIYCEIRTGAEPAELRYSRIPRRFDPAEIRECAESLVPRRCIAVALSNKYNDAPLRGGTDLCLHYSLDSLTVEPCLEGLSWAH